MSLSMQLNSRNSHALISRFIQAQIYRKFSFKVPKTEILENLMWNYVSFKKNFFPNVCHKQEIQGSWVFFVKEAKEQCFIILSSNYILGKLPELNKVCKSSKTCLLWTLAKWSILSSSSLTIWNVNRTKFCFLRM